MSKGAEIAPKVPRFFKSKGAKMAQKFRFLVLTGRTLQNVNQFSKKTGHLWTARVGNATPQSL